MTAHAESVVNIVVLIFAAGAFTGILNETGMADAIASASLSVMPPPTIGPFLAPSPLLAPIYLVCGLLPVDAAEAQRFALKWAILVSLIVLIAALLTDAIPLQHLSDQ